MADPQHGGRGDRVWRPQVVRRRPDGSQIRQHPETLLYKKSSALFGIDLAKRDIAKCHQAVVVEGYTDVMAMHLAGVTTAVASCGTAFGDEHMAMLRRLMMDDNFFRGELIYVFDGDEAGRAAALKAFAGEQHLAGQSFIAVAGDGMDPCDLRLAHGDGALRDLVARRTPLFEFAIRSALAEFDLDSAEGRVGALRRCVPMVAQIKDPTLRDEYARQLAGWVGWDDVAQVVGRVRDEAKQRRRPRRPASAPTETGVAEQAALRPDPRDPTLWPQREALKSALQYPALAGRCSMRCRWRASPTPATRPSARPSTPQAAPAAASRVPSGSMRFAGTPHRPWWPGWSANWAWRRSVSTTTTSCRAISAGCSPACRRCGSVGKSPKSSRNCSACRRSSKATNTTPCSETWWRWRPTGAACSSRPVATT
ncbi:toprim domain protein [Mycobacterium xenopi 4042]|uniref:Toprim domain protein n=1 Tax=Mycobacterium xenopi 4042 TaxID=1299334 RepID=X8AP78_MYCXE|nr:toprim domain protein [Mycobacterium xenopi 4042]